MKADWKKSTLGNVLSTLKNGLNCKQSKDVAGQKISRIESISTASFDINRVGFSEISESDKAKFKLLKGDILFSHINSPIHVGKTATFNEDEDVYHGVNLLLMRPNEEVLPDYLELYLKSLFESGYWLKRCKQSVNQASVNQQDIAQVAIEYPSSVTEQRRIVTLLDEAFADIATAKANAEKNLQNARELFQSCLDSVLNERDQGWITKPLNRIAEFSQGIQVALSEQTNEPSEGLVRFIRIVDYTQRTDDIRYVNNPGQKYWAKKSDIVMVRYGTPGLIGRGIEGIIANNLFKITIIEKHLTNDFLTYFLSQQSIQLFLRNQGALAMPAITFKQLGGVMVTYPADTAQQESIVSLLDSINQHTQRLESIYLRKLTALDNLKKSLLHQAFSGQL